MMVRFGVSVRIGLGLWRVGATISNPVKIVSSGVSKVVAGYDFFLYLDENGSVWGRGGNHQWQLGFEHGGWSVQSKNILSDAHDISVGWNFSFVRLKDGRMLTFGNSWGQLGDDKIVQTQTPVKIPGIQVKAAAANTNSSYLVDKEGSLWSFEKGDWGDLGSGLSLSSLPVQVEEKGVIAVSSKNQTVLFQDENGSLFGFGHGDYGKLGHNSKNHHTPTMLLVTKFFPLHLVGNMELR